MTEKNELKKRKNKETKKETTIEEENQNEPKKNTKNTGKVLHGKDLKKLAEEHRNEIGKKMFKRSIKRMGLIVIAFAVLYLYKWLKQDVYFTPFVTTKDEINNIPFVKQIKCSNDYEDDLKLFKTCAPKLCGRLVIDNLVDDRESTILLSLFKKALLLNTLNINGSASILDLHSGAMTFKDKFVNIYALLKQQNKREYFSHAEFAIYKQVKDKIHKYIAEKFKIPLIDLHLTSPTFFSKLTGNEPLNIHDQYWHLHIDKKTYKSFHYTSLLYLNTYYDQFSGGRFVFVDKEANYTVEPKKSRLLIFTSGTENPHFVERVEKGVRYAITISFTCDQELKIDDPKLLG